MKDNSKLNIVFLKLNIYIYILFQLNSIQNLNNHNDQQTKRTRKEIKLAIRMFKYIICEDDRYCCNAIREIFPPFRISKSIIPLISNVVVLAMILSPLTVGSFKEVVLGCFHRKSLMRRKSMILTWRIYIVIILVLMRKEFSSHTKVKRPNIWVERRIIVVAVVVNEEILVQVIELQKLRGS